MKHAVSTLEGAILDAAVAKAEGWHRCTALAFNVDEFDWRGPPTDDDELGPLIATGDCWEPSTDWADGGPIIERERIELAWLTQWSAHIISLEGGAVEYGPTPLIAAMRAYTAAVFGEFVELP